MVQSGVMCFSAIRAVNASWALVWVADMVSSRTCDGAPAIGSRLCSERGPS